MYIDYRKVAAKRALGHSSPGVVLTPENIDWAEVNEVYKTASDTAAELHTKAHEDDMDRAYEFFIAKKEREWQTLNPESGQFEGNWSDEYPKPAYTKPEGLEDIRRTAGYRVLTDRILTPQSANFAAVLPLLIKEMSTWHVTRNDKGLISGLQFCKDHFNTPERMGMYRFLMITAKSSFLPKQYSAPNSTYSALVPIIMYAQRISKNIKYSEWDRSEIKYVVPSNLAEAMLHTDEKPSDEDLIKDRVIGLTWASGAQVGRVRAANSTHRLYSTKGTCYEGLPEYVEVMFAQIWMAHPDNRTKYMVLDPYNWDSVPLPLISHEVTKTKIKREGDKNVEQVEADPWL